MILNVFVCLHLNIFLIQVLSEKENVVNTNLWFIWNYLGTESMQKCYKNVSNHIKAYNVWPVNKTMLHFDTKHFINILPFVDKLKNTWSLKCSGSFVT